MNSAERDLILKTAVLARSAPEKFEDFIAALRAHTDALKDVCVMSPLEMLQVNQGRAQATAALLKTLSEALKKADELERSPKR